MPKVSSRQKNHKHNTSSVDNNIEAGNSNLKDDKKNNNNNKKNQNYLIDNDLADLKPSFPTTITMKDLIRNAVNSYSRRSLPNAFFAYRMALINEYRIKNRKLPRMGEISKIAKSFWDLEPEYVKESYKTLTRDAKSLYKQNQIVLDKNMNYIKHNNHAVNQNTTFHNFTFNSINFPNPSQNNNDNSPNNNNNNNRKFEHIMT
ncbi:hypothetical protein RclHR1_00470004 [Rhizophagus clarus]|uniref:Uncharacterized protein n=1 Tax=Rhizophagus clarus TaxID=94130 RepID=A0A2Z6RJZ6_9GLOM|nr:hypothetical protein RclHR1_00470004 [Rhizophagus clarus]GES91937.1 hypothetical protein GLOIN_2v101651 [Rhizophagus clarus]